MIKEEKQFNQWFDWYADGVKVFEEADMKQAYLQGRAELEEEVTRLRNENLDIINKYTRFAETDRKTIAELESKIADLEAQIEKMKNWCNCKNYSQCLIELAEQGKGMKPSECCVNCKKWELEDYKTRLERRNKKKQEIKEK